MSGWVGSGRDGSGSPGLIKFISFLTLSQQCQGLRAISKEKFYEFKIFSELSSVEDVKSGHHSSSPLLMICRLTIKGKRGAKKQNIT